MTDGELLVEVKDCLEGPGTRSSIWTFLGTEVESGDQLVFISDHRPGHALHIGLGNREAVVVACVPTWAVISRYPDDREADDG